MKICVAFTSFFLSTACFGQYSIPDEFMNRTILVLMQNRDSSSGSGFFLQDSSDVYFVTARHVMLDTTRNEKGEINGYKFRSNIAELRSYPRTSEKSSPDIMQINLIKLANLGEININNHRDMIIIRIGVIDTVGYTKIVYNEGVARTGSKSRINLYGTIEMIKFDDVGVSEEVFIFGYPKTLGLKRIPQYDFNRPLLRKGVIAGKNAAQKTVVIDCAAYGGNSGGPVILIRGNKLGSGVYSIGSEIKLIGFVTQFIPFIEKIDDKNYHAGNSGYSIIEPIDSILELIQEQRRRKNADK